MHPVLRAQWRWAATLAGVVACAAWSVAGAAGTNAVPAAVSPPTKASPDKSNRSAAPATPAKTNPTSATSRSVQYYDQSRFDDAITLLRDLVENQELEDKSRARALEILARCYVKKGYPVLAKDMFKELLAEKVRRFQADQEIQAALAAYRVDDPDGEWPPRYSQDGAAALKAREFDLPSLRRRGPGLELLDQLTVELLLGVR